MKLHRAKRVAVDIDFTIADVSRPMLEMHNAINATNYKREDVTDWDWASVNMTLDQFYDFYVKAWVDRYHSIGLIVDPRLLREAERYYSLDLVTSRAGHPMSEKTIDPLKKWLRHHGLSDIKLVISKLNEEKSELDYDIYIDDSPNLARKISEDKRKMMFVVDAHNRSIRGTENVIKVRDVNEALLRIIDMAETKAKDA